MSRKLLIGLVCLGALAAAGSAAQQDTGGGDWQHHESVTLGRDAPQQGPTGPRTGEKVTFCGKVVSLVEMGCVGIVGAHDTVELTAVTPKPAVGAVISGIGTISTQGNVCMQGIHLSAASYKPVASCN